MTGSGLQDTPYCRNQRESSFSCPPEGCCHRNTPEAEIQLQTDQWYGRVTHQTILQTREEVSGLQAVLDALLRAVVSLKLDHVPLEQTLVEAVLVASLILPVLKQMYNVNTIVARNWELTLVWSTLLLQYLGRVWGYTSPLWMEHTRSAMDCLHSVLVALFMALRGSWKTLTCHNDRCHQLTSHLGSYVAWEFEIVTLRQFWLTWTRILLLRWLRSIWLWFWWGSLRSATEIIAIKDLLTSNISLTWIYGTLCEKMRFQQ